MMLVLSGAASPGGEYRVRSWHIEDGLPSGHVTAVAQTPDGYLWVGTLRGLVRFDGVRFKVFTAASTPGLGDSRITSLLTDDAGTLWIGSADGNLAKGGEAGLRSCPAPPSGTRRAPCRCARAGESATGSRPVPARGPAP